MSFTQNDVCYGCQKEILDYEICVYADVISDVDGEEIVATYHVDCSEVEQIMNESLMDGDDWIFIDTMEQDDYNWVSIDYPIVAKRVAHKFN